MSEPIQVTRYRPVDGEAFCVCRDCGAVLILDNDVDWVTVHDAWHDRIGLRAVGQPT